MVGMKIWVIQMETKKKALFTILFKPTKHSWKTLLKGIKENLLKIESGLEL